MIAAALITALAGLAPAHTWSSDARAQTQTQFPAQPKAQTPAQTQAPVTQAEEPFVHYYFDQPRTLTLDPTRVAVFATGDGPVTGAAFGARGAPVRNTPVFDVKLVDLPAGRRSRAGVEAALDAQATARSRSVAYASPVFVGEDGGYLIPSPTLLVRFAPGVGASQRDKALSDLGVVELEAEWGGMSGAVRVRTALRDGRDVLRAAARLAQRDDVVFAEPDMMFTGRGALIPNDPDIFQAWGLNNIGQSITGSGIGTVDVDMDVVEAWDTQQGSGSVLTLVIDVGVEVAHPEIRQVAGKNMTSDPTTDGGPVNACDNHGTAVAGCISARINNSQGAGGVAPGSRTVSARTFISDLSCNGSWTTFTSWTVDALDYGVTLGCRVTNNSNYYGFTAPSIESKYEETRADGMVHFSSAGNFGDTDLTYPASLDSVNAVGAITNRGTLASFSNRGDGLAFAAPGVDIYTTDRTGGAGYAAGTFFLADGTSFASPYAAGVAALMLSQNPALTAPQVEQIMRDTTKDLGLPGYDTTFGWGLPDADDAVAAADAFVACAADLNGDGTANVDDVDFFVTMLPDVDGNTVFNPDDVAAFVDAFLAGCP